MTDPMSIAAIASSLIAAIAIAAVAGLKGWQGWLELKRMELSSGRADAPMPQAGNRIVAVTGMLVGTVCALALGCGRGNVGHLGHEKQQGNHTEVTSNRCLLCYKISFRASDLVGRHGPFVDHKKKRPGGGGRAASRDAVRSGGRTARELIFPKGRCPRRSPPACEPAP